MRVLLPIVDNLFAVSLDRGSHSYSLISNHQRPMIHISRNFIVATICMAVASIAAAQDLRAVTEDGRKVIISPDGKWRFDAGSLSSPKSNESASPYQTAVKKFSVAFNPSDWNLIQKRDAEDANKRTFQHKRFPIFAMVIADEMPATTAALKSVILSNAKSAGASTTVLVDQLTDLGGKEIGALRFAAQMQGLEFVFASYYYADVDGNIQVICYTAQSLFFKFQGDCQKFLDGLSIK